MQRLIISLMVLIIVLLGAACNRMPSEDQFIQGTWQMIDSENSNFIRGVLWTFDKGEFKADFDGLAPNHFIGNYKIQSTKENRIVLELFNVETEIKKESSRTIQVVIDNEKEELRIDRRGPFKRIRSNYILPN
ncbi:MAG: hypothetical protein GY810_23455 [Aureispira sp.]|nr:hypothetical protein [Aureispira sp.]